MAQLRGCAHGCQGFVASNSNVGAASHAGNAEGVSTRRSGSKGKIPQVEPASDEYSGDDENEGNCYSPCTPKTRELLFEQETPGKGDTGFHAAGAELDMPDKNLELREVRKEEE